MIKGYTSLSNIDSHHERQHRTLFENCLGVLDKVATLAPTRDTLPAGYCQFANISGTRRLYWNHDNSLFYVNFTAA